MTGVHAQVAAVRAQLDAAQAQDVRLHAALHFVGTDLPWYGSSSAQGVTPPA